MNKLQYKIHLILQSKYKIIIFPLINILIFAFYYSQSTVYCMTESDPEITMTAKEILLQTQIDTLTERLQEACRSRDFYSARVKELIQEKNQIEATYITKNDHALSCVFSASDEIEELKEVIERLRNQTVPTQTTPLLKQLNTHQNNSYFTWTNAVCGSILIGSVIITTPFLIHALPLVKIPSLW